MSTVHIDGSYGEGGGQVLRTSLSLSALLGCELTISNIRAGRPKPGLAAQHVTCVRAAAQVCGATVSGDEVGSQEVNFRPAGVRCGQYTFDVADVRPSAGSSCLVFQTVLAPLVFASASSRVTLRGGTNVPWSPCFEYVRHAFLPALARMGAQVKFERVRGGWYPAGGGEMIAEITPLAGPLRPLSLQQRGKLTSLQALSTVSAQLPDHIARRQADGALKLLPHDMSRIAHRKYDRPEGGPGTCIVLAAEFENGHAGATALGMKGKPAEKVGAETAEGFTAFLDSGAAVDLHLGDQLLLYAALAGGESTVLAEQCTEHLRTNVWVIQQFLGADIELEGEAPVMIRIRGTDFTSS